jgi:hypothetical protein
VFKGDNLTVKGALIRPSLAAPEPQRESRSRAQTQLDDLSVDGAFHVLSGCARAHSPDVAPKLVSELETRSRAFYS